MPPRSWITTFLVGAIGSLVLAVVLAIMELWKWLFQ